MAPKLGDTVFVTETDPLTDNDVVSPGIVTHVYSEDDANGDSKWWDAVKDKGMADVTVFRRNGTVETIANATEGDDTYTDDEGRERRRSGTYATSPDGGLETVTDNVTVPAPTAAPTAAQAEPGNPATAADTQSGDGTAASQSGAQTTTEQNYA